MGASVSAEKSSPYSGTPWEDNYVAENCVEECNASATM